MEHLRQKPGGIPKSLPCRNVELFLMGVASSGGPDGCDNLSG